MKHLVNEHRQVPVSLEESEERGSDEHSCRVLTLNRALLEKIVPVWQQTVRLHQNVDGQ